MRGDDAVYAAIEEIRAHLKAEGHGDVTVSDAMRFGVIRTAKGLRKDKGEGERSPPAEEQSRPRKKKSAE